MASLLLVRLVLVGASVGVATGPTIYAISADSADRFFDESNLEATTVGGVLTLSARTPLAVACGAAFRDASSSSDYALFFSGAMDPGVPSLDHDVALEGVTGDGDVRFFAFLPFGRGVYVSATYALRDGALSPQP